MEAGRKPTQAQRERIRTAGLKPRDYLVLAQIGSRLALMYRGTGRMQVIVLEKKQREYQDGKCNSGI